MAIDPLAVKYGTNFENAQPSSATKTLISLRDNNNLAIFGRFLNSSVLPTTVNEFECGGLFIASDTGILYQNSQTNSALAPVLNKVVTGATFNTVKVTLTSAQILALGTTAIQLLPAPGTGLVYEVMAVTGRMNFLTAAYATHTALDIIDTTTGDILFSDASALLAATSTKISTVPVNTNSGVGVYVTSNGTVSAKVAAGNPVTGAGSLDLYVTYKVITL